MCAQDLLPPYLDVLIPKLLGLLQNGQKLVQEGALTAMASVADCAKDKFVKYYNQVGTTMLVAVLCSLLKHGVSPGLVTDPPAEDVKAV